MRGKEEEREGAVGPVEWPWDCERLAGAILECVLYYHRQEYQAV